MAETTKKATAEEKADVPMVEFTIDGRKARVPKGTTVLKAALAMGIDIPFFCWHPKLKPVGACRMCYVEIEGRPKLEVSCATEAMEGMVVHTNSDLVKRGRRAIIEFTLINHPLDCPTCDKGGECDLQDLTFRHGYDDSRFDFSKYRFVDPETKTTFDDVRIGPEIVLNRNRCILCYKCVRANKEAFGEYDLGSYERGNITEINAAPGEQVDNPFSGNLVEICPVGALTNTDWRYQIRVWLTKTSPSICNFTSSGANITFYKEDHKNHVYRVTSRMNDDIDDGWLADITRYGYQIVNSPERLKTPKIKKGGQQVEATWEEALETIHKRFTDIKEKKGSVCIGGLAAPNLDNATLFSFQKFFRKVLKSNNIDFRNDYRMLPKGNDSNYGILASRPFKIADIDDSDVILTFGSDVIREYPNLYLRIRKAVNFNQSRVFVVAPYAQKAADVAEAELVYTPGTGEVIVNALCLALIDGGFVDASRVGDLKSKIAPGTVTEAAKICGVDEESIRLAARALANARKATVIVGDMVARSTVREEIAAALCNLNKLVGIDTKGQIAALAKYANSRGADRLGAVAAPNAKVVSQLKELWGEYPDCVPLNTDAMFAAMKKEEIVGMFILGGNPMLLYPDREFVRESLEKVDFLVACDLFETETTEIADVVLPLASWAEYTGDYVNLEGRVQTALQAIRPRHKSRPGFAIMEDLAKVFNVELFENNAACDHEISRVLELDSSIPWPTDYLRVAPFELQIPKDYPSALFVCDDHHHRGHLTEKAESLTNFSPKHRLSNGDLVRVESEVGKVIVPAKISEHLRNDVLLVPRNFSTTPVTSLLMRKKRIDRVRITRVDE